MDFISSFLCCFSDVQQVLVVPPAVTITVWVLWTAQFPSVPLLAYYFQCTKERREKGVLLNLFSLALCWEPPNSLQPNETCCITNTTTLFTPLMLTTLSLSSDLCCICFPGHFSWKCGCYAWLLSCIPITNSMQILVLSISVRLCMFSMSSCVELVVSHSATPTSMVKLPKQRYDFF